MFTLIIPTYNRPLLLRRLLHYLEKADASFPIHLLDSSDVACSHQNRKLVDQSSLEIRYVEYPPDTSPFRKFADGFDRVRTRYSALCADDDVILLDGLTTALEFLETHAEYAVAHGHYFDFRTNDSEFTLERWRYADDDSLTGPVPERVVQLIRRYSALTYGVVRTDIARWAFGHAADQQNILAQELLSGLLCAIGGKVKRLAIAFYGRRNDRLTHYDDAHPLQRLVTSAPELFSDYRELSTCLLAAFDERRTARTGSPLPESLLDLSHLSYLFTHVHVATLDFIIDGKLQGMSDQAILEEALFVQADSEARSHCGAAIRKLRMLKYRAFPRLKIPRLRARGNTAAAGSAGGDSRRHGFRIQPDFVAGLDDLSLPADLGLSYILQALDLYR